MKKKYITILILILIALIFSTILTFSNIEKICSSTEGCFVVNFSEYNSFFGIKNSIAGMIAFTMLGIIIYHHIKHPKPRKKKLIQIAIIIASMIALYFLYLQFFILNTICKYCFIIDIAILLSLIILFFWKEK